ncbi:hypothetical protein HMPREF9003_1553 [Bifidobacterium dentium JCVIHMP022]|nr:hypothetical protein HMPREF9003_1553 [Bifidobacterium dentium JCVIHMP022]
MPDIRPTAPIVFDGFVANSWQNNGRSGVSFSAAAVSEA